MTSSMLPGLQKAFESVAKIKDDLGVALARVELIERRWSGANVGDGNAKETVKPLLPSPLIVDLGTKIQFMPGGSLQQGDLILKNIPKTKWSRDELLLASSASNVESFYRINGKTFKTVHISERLLSWTVHIRPQAGG